MKQMIIYLGVHFLACLVFFAVIQRPIFMAYNHKANPECITGTDIKDIYAHGYKTDMAVAAYLTAVPWMLATYHAFMSTASIMTPLVIYEAVAAVAVSLICIGDTALYKFWQSKIDSSVLMYLKHPKEAFASVTFGYIAVGVLCLIVMCCTYFGMMYAVIRMTGIGQTWPQATGTGHYILTALASVLGLGLLFIAIRGLNSRPNSPSIAYYCKNMFYNHSAINPVYNFIYSLSIKDEFNGKFRFYPDDECNAAIAEMYPTSGKPQMRLLNTRRPNILLIIWESLCAGYIESLGGKPGVTPNFDRFAQEGVLFTQVRAGSFRTDRGLVCIHSGIPGQPTTSIIKYVKKLPALPALPRTLAANGYNTSVIHGGDLSVLHMSDYYAASGHQRFVSLENISDSNAPKCRWGIHDNYMFDYVYDDITGTDNNVSPWMITFMTLSSHEPFIVPYHRLDHNISNAYAFVDDAFGRFVDRLRKTDKWDDLLIIVVGDHGMNNNDVPMSHHDYSHIPILMLGGAVNGHAVIDTPMAQTDLAATLLGQMDIDHSDFTYSRDVLADTYVYPFTMHTYTGGFVYSDSTGYTDFDLVADTAIHGEDSIREKRGKMIIQYLYKDLANR